MQRTVSLSTTWQKIRALVVGINAYKPESGLPELKNAVPDARAVRDMLRDKGVEVFYGENLTIEEFHTLEEQFRDALQKDDIAIVSFAGHACTFNSAMHLMTVTDGKPRVQDDAVNILQLNIRLAQ